MQGLRIAHVLRTFGDRNATAQTEDQHGNDQAWEIQSPAVPERMPSKPGIFHGQGRMA